MAKSKKLRLSLSLELLQAISTEAAKDSSPLAAHRVEVVNSIGTKLFKLSSGTAQATYTANVVELTLEEKVQTGVATEEEEIAYWNSLEEDF